MKKYLGLIIVSYLPLVTLSIPWKAWGRHSISHFYPVLYKTIIFG